MFRFFVPILCRLFVLQRVLYCNRYLTGHLLKQDDIIFIKMLSARLQSHQNANHTITALEREITPDGEAFLHQALINNLALRVPKGFRIFADLFEAIDPNALTLPQHLPRDRAIHRHQ